MAHIRNSRSGGGTRRRPSSKKAAAKASPGKRRSPRTGRSAQVSSGDSKRRAPRQERARSTADAVVEAAEQLLVEVGYAASSTNAIASRAGVSIGSLYQYFSGKEDVFRVVVRRHRAEVRPVVASALVRMTEPDTDWIEVVLDLLRAMARVNADNPRLMAALERELGWLEHDDDEELELSEEVAEILRLRTSLTPRQRAVNARLLLVVLVPLSRWLVHGKPRELDTELFVQGTGKMLRGLIDG